jgi:ribosomal RNA assembly protein
VIRIPDERVAVLIGEGGETRQEIEDRTGVELDIDSGSGEVTIDEEEAFNPVLALQCRDIVRAIGRGFAPQKAFRLLQDDVYFDLVKLTDWVGDNRNRQETVRGRIIGSGGRTREAIETFTGVNVAIHGKTVGLIGEMQEVEAAREAVEMLVEGASHNAVYNFLEEKRRELRLEEIGLD